MNLEFILVVTNSWWNTFGSLMYSGKEICHFHYVSVKELIGMVNKCQIVNNLHIHEQIQEKKYF